MTEQGEANPTRHGEFKEFGRALVTRGECRGQGQREIGRRTLERAGERSERRRTRTA